MTPAAVIAAASLKHGHRHRLGLAECELYNGYIGSKQNIYKLFIAYNLKAIHVVAISFAYVSLRYFLVLASQSPTLDGLAKYYWILLLCWSR